MLLKVKHLVNLFRGINLHYMEDCTFAVGFCEAKSDTFRRLIFNCRTDCREKKKAGYAPAMPIRQSDKQWVGGDLFVRQIYYRPKQQIPLPLFFSHCTVFAQSGLLRFGSQLTLALCTIFYALIYSVKQKQIY